VSENNGADKDPVDILLGGLDRILDNVHDRIVRPLLILTRYIAFGFLLTCLVLVMLIAGTIGVLRFSNVYIFQGYVWASYLALGALFVVIGLLIWRRRSPAPVRKK
jgi:hypothetical protein